MRFSVRGKDSSTRAQSTRPPQPAKLVMNRPFIHPMSTKHDLRLRPQHDSIRLRITAHAVVRRSTRRGCMDAAYRYRSTKAVTSVYLIQSPSLTPSSKNAKQGHDTGIGTTMLDVHFISLPSVPPRLQPETGGPATKLKHLHLIWHPL